MGFPRGKKSFDISGDEKGWCGFIAVEEKRLGKTKVLKKGEWFPAGSEEKKKVQEKNAPISIGGGKTCRAVQKKGKASCPPEEGIAKEKKIVSAILDSCAESPKK